MCQNNQFKLFSKILNKSKFNVNAIAENITHCKTNGQYINTFDQPTNFVI